MASIEALRETFWERHSNPKSGWSRVALTPLLLYAVYRHNWKLAAASIVFAVLNPVLFSPPEDDDAWMTRVVRAEQWWTDERNERLLGVTYPSVLNLLNVPVTVYAFLAAARKQPVRAAISGMASMALKFWYVGELVRRYDARTE